MKKEPSLLLVTLRSSRGNDPPGENRHFRPPPLRILHPPHHLSTASLRAGRKSVRIASLSSLFISLFFSTRPNEFFQIQACLITDFDCWLCYFHYYPAVVCGARGIYQHNVGVMSRFSALDVPATRVRSGLKNIAAPPKRTESTQTRLARPVIAEMKARQSAKIQKRTSRGTWWSMATAK
jgi:hypothetical protein